MDGEYYQQRGIDYKQEALFKSLMEHEKISESAENYVRALLKSRDIRDRNGHGIDSIDTSFTLPIYYEIKTGLNDVKIFDTQFHYQYGKANRYYVVMVKREDGLQNYRKTKTGKVLNVFSLDESLLFNFGDICILPLEIVKEHYIIQGAKNLANTDKEGIKKYKKFSDLVRAKRKEVRNYIERIVERQKNGKQIPHEERENVALSFNQAKQIIVGCGEHFNLLKRFNSFKEIYKNDFIIIPGPYRDYDKKTMSNIFLLDFDNLVIGEIARKLTQENFHGKNRIYELNEIKKQRLELYKELEEKKKEFGWGIEQEPNLEKRLISLSKWQGDMGPLFS